MFLFTCISAFIATSPLAESFKYFYNSSTGLLINFLQNLYPDITFSIFNSGAVRMIVFFPLFWIIIKGVNFVFIKSQKRSIQSATFQFLRGFSPKLTILINSILFYYVHFYSFDLYFGDPLSGLLSISKIVLFVFGIILGYVAYRYSLKLSILLHILANFCASFLIINDIQPLYSILLYSVQFTLFGYILFLIYKEAKRLKVFQNLDI